MKNVKKNVQNKVQESLLGGENKPKTSQEFKRNCQVFKKDYKRLWEYLKNCVEPSDILKLYKRLEIEAETMIKLVSALNEGKE